MLKRNAIAPQPELRFALLAIGALTLWRVGMLAVARIELSTDEAQYWLWGQEMALGAFSKPPLIGWLIRGVSELAGVSAFGVRLAAPLLHGLTAVLVLMLARRMVPAPVAALAGLSYVTMPAVTLGSALMTTDTPMLAALALALLMQHRLAEGSSFGGALLLGAAIGLGAMSKQAMLFGVAGMGLAALVSAEWRIARRDLVIAALVAVAIVAPNLWWIAQHDFVTMRHLGERGAASGIGFHPLSALRYLAEQLAVMGPLLFPGFLLGAWRLRRRDGGALRGAAVAGLTVLAIVLLQAISSRALANWGVGMVIGGVIVAAPWLATRRVLALVSLVLGLAVAVALPLVARYGTGWRLPGGQLMLARYLGHAELARHALDLARIEGARAIVAHDRSLLADLSWQGRDSEIATYAAPAPERAAIRHHWDLAHPLPQGYRGRVALLLREGEPPACATGPRHRWKAGPGFAEGAQMVLALTDASCLYGDRNE